MRACPPRERERERERERGIKQGRETNQKMEAAAAATTIKMNAYCGGNGIKTMEIRWVTRKDNSKTVSTKLKPRIPIYLSSSPSHIDPQELRNLYSSCNYSCHRFPKVDQMGKVAEPVDVKKLTVALSHSAVLVSVFCNIEDVGVGNDCDDDDDECGPSEGKTLNLVGLGDLLERVVPSPIVSPSSGKLVGFGRAVSDCGLTASIFDVMVIPSLQGLGIGKMIVKRIVRILTRREIYDIAALCSSNERLFFKACGFGDDIMGSTTMMYTRTVSSHVEGDQMVTYAGRKFLLAPPLRNGPENLRTFKP